MGNRRALCLLNVSRVPGLLRNDRGTEIVEAALTLPIIIILVVGMLEFARAAIIYTTLQDAARQGARYAVVSPNDSAGIVRAATAAAVVTGNKPLTVSVTCPTGSCVTGQPVEVTVQYRFRPMTVLIPGFGRNGIPVTTHSSMIVE